MDFNQFLNSRRPRWQKLEELLDRVDRIGIASFKPNEINELFSLYRLVSSDLNLVQTVTGNPSLVDFLEGLVARAYAIMIVPRRANFFWSWWMILRHYFPAAIRSEWKSLGLSALTMVLGILFGFGSTWAKPAFAEMFLPPEHLDQSPRERVAELEQMERDGHTRIDSAGKNALFSTFLFNNNIRVSVLAFALGLTFGIGTIIMLFYNGAMVGSLAALYLMDGQIKFFLGWVGPHGSIELPCVTFAGAAGLMMALRQLRRSEVSTMAQIRLIRPKLVDIVIGTSSLLVVAGSIEGGFSQINEPTISYWFKISVAIVLFSLLCGYLFLLPAKPRPDVEDDDARFILGIKSDSPKVIAVP